MMATITDNSEIRFPVFQTICSTHDLFVLSKRKLVCAFSHIGDVSPTRTFSQSDLVYSDDEILDGFHKQVRDFPGSKGKAKMEYTIISGHQVFDVIKKV